mmetsp:Transcript_17813/g.21812  ORF Transcript_17813/g.21812 Transcript_17813/m.21812 type:complete len:580 (-) Transcript_17813:315-2054(-)
MKLDATVMRTMSPLDFTVLSAIEKGMKTHSLVPSPLIATYSNLRHGGTPKILSSLLRDKLLSHESIGYDGYRLTNSGYDILALHNLKLQKQVVALGDRIGTGKESDVYIAVAPGGRQVILKFHRLGRTSFRAVKKKRDYFSFGSKGGNTPNSWLFLSSISAQKEFGFMKALHSVGYPTPTPLARSNHVVVMGLVRGIPLYQLSPSRISAAQSESIFLQSMSLTQRLAKNGLVHCDLNEFNLMVDLSGGIQSKLHESEDAGGDHYVRHSGGESVVGAGALSSNIPMQNVHVDNTGEVITEERPAPISKLEDGEAKPLVTLIDFPQMISVKHPNAEELWERDVKCLVRFFEMKLKCRPPRGWEEYIGNWDDMTSHQNKGTGEGEDGNDDEMVNLGSKAQIRLDEELQASGYSEQDGKRETQLHYHQSYTTNDSKQQETVDDTTNVPPLAPASTVTPDKQTSKESAQAVAIQAHVKQNEDPNPADANDSADPTTLVEIPAPISDCDILHKSIDDDQSSVCSSLDEEDMYQAQQNEKWARQEAKQKVQKQISESKTKGRKKDAFKSRNRNKSYVKGRRVYDDM